MMMFYFYPFTWTHHAYYQQAYESEVRTPQIQQIDWHKRYPSEVILKGPSSVRSVALTFDDGPDQTWTPQIANILGKFKVQATFFVLGSQVKANPSILRHLDQQGHEIGNHTWDHPLLTKISTAEVKRQIQQTDQIIHQVIGKQTRLFRPPYGALSNSIIHTVKQLNHKIILWNVDSLDWKGVSTNTMVQNVLSHTSPGSILLFHSAYGRSGLGNTVAALPQIIQRLRSNNFSFRTVSSLINL
ncbi:polysaccharide deacetylase family protein [Seinonella peptonophila]|nr:polysaccharide deacetylase family protein [Seinonella peptonophila]